MSPKENFIKKMHHYFNVNYDDFTIKRIERWLDEYCEDIDEQRIVSKQKLVQVQKNKKNDKELLKPKYQ